MAILKLFTVFCIGMACAVGVYAQQGSQGSQDQQNEQGEQAEQQQADAVERPSGQSLTDKASYLLGYNFMSEFKNQKVEINFDKLLAGLKDAANGVELEMSDEEIQSVQQAFQQRVMAQQQQMMREAAEKNRQEGAAFLEQNAEKAGVKQYESGLQVKVLKEGDGPVPTAEDTVRVLYKGMFPDGETFDSTDGEPAEIPVGRVIPGMSEALQKMKVGSKWKLFIPGALSYGAQGRRPVIGPNQTLIFEVELLGIVDNQ